MVKRARPLTSINDGFFAQLKRFASSDDDIVARTEATAALANEPSNFAPEDNTLSCRRSTRRGIRSITYYDGSSDEYVPKRRRRKKR